jgi:O-antigen/teichoic acid export membrane protein
VVGVLFPAFASTVDRDPAEAASYYALGLKVVYALLFPVLLAVVAFAPEALGLWLGGPFRDQSAPAARVLAVGVFVYGLNHVPAELINAAGRPEFTAKVRLAELLPFFAGAWLLTSRYGVAGAAAAWTLRVLADSAILFGRAGFISRDGWRGRSRVLAAGLAVTGALGSGLALGPFRHRAAYFAGVFSMYLVSIVALTRGGSFGQPPVSSLEGSP